jgi:hypothetical protein
MRPFCRIFGVSAKYLGEREEELMKKRGRQTGKERFTIHASLCGRGDLLKAPGSVASYLADRLCNLSNDKWLLFFQKHRWLAQPSGKRSAFGEKLSTYL